MAWPVIPLKLSPAQVKDGITTYIARFDPRSPDYEPKFVPTINGLANHLGLSKTTLLRYRERDEYIGLFEPVMQALEGWWEAKLASSSPVGAIFWLKNRPDRSWNDRTQTDVNHTVNALTDEQLDARIMALMNNVPMMQTIAAPDPAGDGKKPTEH